MAIIDLIRSFINTIKPDNTPIVTPPLTNTISNQPDNEQPVNDQPVISEPSINQPVIEYYPTVNKSVVSAYALHVISNILKDSANTHATITSSARTPAEQAHAMYTNIVTRGTVAQKQLYGPYGDLVIDVYVQQKAAGKSQSEILDAMTAKIVEVGPQHVSRHCADFTKLVVVDIAPSSIVNKNEFVATATKYKSTGIVSEFFHPGDGDPAFHLEIPNKVLG